MPANKMKKNHTSTSPKTAGARRKNSERAKRKRTCLRILTTKRPLTGIKTQKETKKAAGVIRISRKKKPTRRCDLSRRKGIRRVYREEGKSRCTNSKTKQTENHLEHAADKSPRKTLMLERQNPCEKRDNPGDRKRRTDSPARLQG